MRKTHTGHPPKNLRENSHLLLHKLPPHRNLHAVKRRVPRPRHVMAGIRRKASANNRLKPVGLTARGVNLLYCLPIWDNFKKVADQYLPELTDSMLTSTTKRLTVPFSSPKSSFSEVESAAVYAYAELNRSRGGGLLSRQPQETLRFIAKVGYPFWVIPRNGSALVFDGLDLYSQIVSYGEAASAAFFMSNLQTYQAPRENYVAFLCDHSNYFQQPPKTKQFTFRGLIADMEFLSEFSLCRKEFTELTPNAALLLPLLEEQTITTTLSDLDKLLSSYTDDAAKLQECLKQVKKTTSQYVTEIEYEASAAKEEADAKIKAQQEFINPQIAKLQKEYNRRTKEIIASYDAELEDNQKLQNKTDKFIASAESELRDYEKNAKAAGKKGHEVYEKRWREKIKQSERELSGLRKELKTLENNASKLAKQKSAELSNLTLEHAAAMKLAREPIIQLETARDEKIFAYKQESNRLIAYEKPIVEGIDRSTQLREGLTGGFDKLGIGDPQLKAPFLIYVPFYVVCYESGLARRYLFISPSGLGYFDLSAKLKGAFGGSKISGLLVPRYRSIGAVISKAQAFTQANSQFEGQLWSIGEKNNLLHNSGFCEGAKAGLPALKQQGWLTDREASELGSQLTA